MAHRPDKNGGTKRTSRSPPARNVSTRKMTRQTDETVTAVAASGPVVSSVPAPRPRPRAARPALESAPRATRPPLAPATGFVRPSTSRPSVSLPPTSKGVLTAPRPPSNGPASAAVHKPNLRRHLPTQTTAPRLKRESNAHQPLSPSARQGQTQATSSASIAAQKRRSLPLPLLSTPVEQSSPPSTAPSGSIAFQPPTPAPAAVSRQFEQPSPLSSAPSGSDGSQPPPPAQAAVSGPVEQSSPPSTASLGPKALQPPTPAPAAVARPIEQPPASGLAAAPRSNGDWSSSAAPEPDARGAYPTARRYSYPPVAPPPSAVEATAPVFGGPEAWGFLDPGQFPDYGNYQMHYRGRRQRGGAYHRYQNERLDHYQQGGLGHFDPNYLLIQQNILHQQQMQRFIALMQIYNMSFGGMWI